MAVDRHVKLFHSPQSRSVGVHALLHELDADFSVQVLNLRAKEQRGPEYLKVNPMGKVPAILHRGELIAEQVAVYIYLGDLYADRGLAPQVGDVPRGPYLRWTAFYGSSFEPALMDKAMKHEPAPPSTSPYGDYDTMLSTLVGQLSKGPYMLGDKFQVLDVLWASALDFMVKFGLIEALPVFKSYVARVMERPAIQRSHAKDAEYLAAQGTS